MYFESVEISSFESIVSSILFAFDNATAGNANVMTNSHRETVNTAGMTYIQALDGFSGMEEKFNQQFPCFVHSAIERSICAASIP